ncbi:hypothetical protein D3C71_1236760 [compost metagenome]
MRAHHIALAAIQLGKLLECRHQTARIELLGLQLVERIVVRRAFLRLRELRVDELLGQIAQLRRIQRGNRGATGSTRRIARGRHRIGGLHGLLAMAQCDVADFMAHHAHHFVVRHHVHQAAVDTDATVGHGPGVDVFGEVDLVAGLLAVNTATQRLGDLLQARVVLAARSRDLFLCVALRASLVRQRLDFGIAQRGSLHDLAAGAHQAADIEGMRCGVRGKRNGQRGNGVADLHGNKLLLANSMRARRQFYICRKRSKRFATEFRKCQFRLHKSRASAAQAC